MDVSSEILILVGLIVLTSGCMNGGDTQSEGDQAINVNDLRVEPSQIYSGSSTNVILDISNVGELPAEITLNTEGGQYSDRILTDRCRDTLDVTNHEVIGPGDRNQNSYTLEPRTDLRFSWQLENPSSSNIPLNGRSCNLRFEVPFDYSVNAFRQVQFKESRDAEGSEGLQSQSSRGPMMLNIDILGSTAGESSTFIAGDQAEARITMRNQAEEGTSFTGFIEADKPEIEVNGDNIELGEECEDIDGTLTMYDGESQEIRCDISLDNEDFTGSTRGEITAEAEYTYVQNLGSRTVEIEYRGN